MGPDLSFGDLGEPLNYDDTGLLDESSTEDLASFQLETGLPLVPTDERYD